MVNHIALRIRDQKIFGINMCGKSRERANGERHDSYNKRLILFLHIFVLSLSVK
jgi:hypothetical protein